MEKTEKRHIWIFALSLGVIAVLFAVLALYVADFNGQTRTLVFTQADTGSEQEGADCAVTIQPRGGSTDSWIKRVDEEDGTQTQYAGIIYDVILKNLTDAQIRDWTLRIEMPQDCCINNAWCGEIEFHQSTASDELVQTLDLRKCIENEVEFIVDAQVVGTDLMIPMYAGDYFIYLPSVDDEEDIIKASALDEGLYQTKRVGFICYHETTGEDLTPLEFPQATLTYQLHRSMTDMPFFYIIAALLGVWGIAAITTFNVDIRTRRLLEQTRRDSEIIEQSISAFMGFIDAKDPTTNGHSRRVALYSSKLARKMGLPESECKRIYYIGLMHDCGKIGIPDAILKKPDKLTDAEYEIIKTHTTQGGRILQDFTSIEHMKDGAMYHHERYDGTGYPEGLKGEEIPLVARIICVADSFDVMNSERCYKNKLTKDDILEQIRLNRGTQFDPKLADCFLELLKEGEISF